MKLWILSDLHLEQCFWDLPEPRPEYDILVAAGDIHIASLAVSWLVDRANGHPVIYVPGNQEWYGCVLFEALDRAKSLAKERGIHLLSDAAVTIEGIRFLGATLWTDYELMAPSPISAEDAMMEASRCMNDHRLIEMRPDICFQPSDARALHETSRNWLTGELACTPAGVRKTVVVTHHLPDPRSIDPRFDGDPLNPAFASRMGDLVENGGADLWIHGHTHSVCDYVAGGCRVICNPKGYGPLRLGGLIENSRFDPRLVVEI